MDLSQHTQALLISLASSTDNFMIGLSCGLTLKPLEPTVLWGIALCNAVGCYIATSGGSLGAEYLVDHVTANAMACLAFAYLAVREYLEGVSSASSLEPKKVSLDLALPMTLNNLAGGVTAGLLAISPLWNFAYALFVSVLTMWLGYRLGKVFSGGLGQQQRWLVYCPICIYLALSYQSFRDMWN